VTLGHLSCTLRRRAASALAACAALLALGCGDVQAPLPQPLPPNIDIRSTPAYGDTVAPDSARTLVLEFSRPMEPYSLLLLRRISFLLPVSVDALEGHWNDDRTRVEFRLLDFPVQPGATYEAVFAGLRTADGELYNRSPYAVLYDVDGVPDLLPMSPHARLASREFCRRIGKTSGTCNVQIVMHSASVGLDSMALETRCASCANPERRDLFRRLGDQVQWLGFDIYAKSGALQRSVRWRQPPGIFALPPRQGATLGSAVQTAPDGTTLEQWSARLAGTDSPGQLVVASVVPIQVQFTRSWVVEIESRIAVPGSVPEHRLERWWLYPGVGLVRRETRLEREGDAAPRIEIDSYAPDVSLVSER